jgi:hypothetical protein
MNMLADTRASHSISQFAFFPMADNVQMGAVTTSDSVAWRSM